MFLKQLYLHNFKNYHSLSLSFSQKIIAFTGNNGIGKTNLLDAIHYLALTKSYFQSIEAHNIKHGEDAFMLQGVFNKNDELLTIDVSYKQRKVFRKNKKEYRKLAEHIGLIPVIMISPNDTNLITGGSEIRRKFIDSTISQFNKEYLKNLIHYNRVLLQRNSLLKRFFEMEYFDEATLQIWDDQLIVKGEYIYQKRSDTARKIEQHLKKYYQVLSEGKENVQMLYQSHLQENDFSKLLQQNIKKDRLSQHTSTGIHKDDLILMMNDFPIKKFGSQGQQKTFLTALKLAQYELLKETGNTEPILLLDDIFDKLDEKRIQALLALMNNDFFGQVFLTDTDAERVKNILSKANIANFEIIDVHQLNTPQNA